MVHATAFYAALMGFFIVYMGRRVAYCRRDNQIGIGGNDHPELGVLIRAHGNAVENIPITLLLMALAELNGASGFLLHLYGIVLVASRIAHAHGFIESKGRAHPARLYGTMGNWLLIAALGAHNILLVWFG